MALMLACTMREMSRLLSPTALGLSPCKLAAAARKPAVRPSQSVVKSLSVGFMVRYGVWCGTRQVLVPESCRCADPLPVERMEGLWVRIVQRSPWSGCFWCRSTIQDGPDSPPPSQRFLVSFELGWGVVYAVNKCHANLRRRGAKFGYVCADLAIESPLAQLQAAAKDAVCCYAGAAFWAWLLLPSFFG